MSTLLFFWSGCYQSHLLSLTYKIYYITIAENFNIKIAQNIIKISSFCTMRKWGLCDLTNFGIFYIKICATFSLDKKYRVWYNGKFDPRAGRQLYHNFLLLSIGKINKKEVKSLVNLTSWHNYFSLVHPFVAARLE